MGRTSAAEGQVPWWCSVGAKGGAAVTSGAELSGSVPFPTKAAQGACWDLDICPQHPELGPAHLTLGGRLGRSRWQVLVVATNVGQS